jgi:DNA-binding NarL/FixJ family response regulator
VSRGAAALGAPAADVAVLEIDLPDMDGVSLAVELFRCFRVTRNVFFTTSTDENALARAAVVGPVIAKRAGVDALIAKLEERPRRIPAPRRK